MHHATLLSYLLAMLLSYVHLSSAQSYASINILEPSESSTTLSLSEDAASTSSSLLDNSSSLPTGTTETSTVTSSPQIFPTYPPGLMVTESVVSYIPSATDGSSTLTVLDEVTTDPTLVPSTGFSPSSVDEENTWFTPPPPSANLPSPPSSASTLSIYANGPVSYCKTINVWWAGGVSPYNIYYMLLEPNQTVSDYTVEYTVGTKTSYGPVYIVQLGDLDMQTGQKRRGLTRIRIEDAAGTSKIAWVQNLEPDPHAPCGAILGASTPKPPQSTMSTVKFVDHTTIGSGSQLTTAMVLTIDGERTTIFPSVTEVARLSNVAQPVPDVSTGSAAPPRQTEVGNAPGNSNSFNESTSVSGVAVSNPQLGGQSTPGTIVQSSVQSGGNSASRSTTTVSSHGQVSNSAINPPNHGTSTSRASNTLSFNRANVSGTSHSSSIRNTSQSGTTDNQNLNTLSSNRSNVSGTSHSGTIRNTSQSGTTDNHNLNTLSSNRSNVSGTSYSGTIRNTSQSGTTDSQTSSIILSGETTSSISSSSSTIGPGVANAANETGSGKENYIVIRLSTRIFALVVALLVSAVLACVGAAFFIHRKRSLRKSESHDHLF